MITLKNAYHIYTAITELSGERLPFRDAHTLLMAKRALEPHVQFYAEKERELVEKYAVKNADGKVEVNDNRFTLAAEHAVDFTREHNELDAVEVGVTLSAHTLHAIPAITPSALEALMLLFDFEEDTE